MKQKRAAIISGGGARGAYTVGRLRRLNRDYDFVGGVSTGALMTPFVLLKDYFLLEEAYTSVNQDTIFNVNPFNRKGNISVLNLLCRFVRGKKTLGESEPLRKLIKSYLTEDLYLELKNTTNKDKEGMVAVQNCNTEKVEHKLISSEDYLDFVDWMWASANAPGFMSILEKDGSQYVDGGLSELHSLSYAIKAGYKEVDLFLHRPKHSEGRKGYIKNMRHLLMRLYDVQRNEIENNDLELGLALAKLYKAKVNVYYLPDKLTSNSLIFDKDVMREWVMSGYKDAHKNYETFDFTEQ